MRKRLGIVFGTRPDAIKMAPIVFELQKHAGEFDPVVISTGQHRQMLDQVLEVFDVKPEIELDVMRNNQSLSGLSCRILTAMDALLAEKPLDCVLVQGDTTTAFATSLESAGSHRRERLPAMGNQSLASVEDVQRNPRRYYR